MTRPIWSLLAAGAVASAAVLVPVTAAAAATAVGTTYHLDCSVGTDGDGVIAPWRTIADVNAHGAFNPGDQILVRRGTTCTGRLTLVGSGSASAPIVLGAYGSGSKPTVRGNGTADGTAAIQLGNSSFWTMQDLRVTNTAGGRSSSRYRSGVMVRNDGGQRTSGIVIQRLTVENVASNMSVDRSNPREWGGIVVIALQKDRGGFAGVTIRDNVVRNLGRTGIIVTNHNYPKAANTGVRITGNTVSHTRGDGIVDLGSIKTRIDHNVVAHAADLWPCAECRGISPATANAALYTLKSKNALIDHNEVYGTKVNGGDGEGLDIDISAISTVVEYNYSHDNEGGGLLFCGSTNAIARFNILENNKKSAVAFIGSYPAKNTSFYNNTVYQAKSSGAGTVRYFNGAHGKGIRFFNNIVYNSAKGYYNWPTSVWSRSNTYVGEHKTGEPHGAGYSWMNPGLKHPGAGGVGFSTLKGYKPAHPSTFRSGIAIPKSVMTDFFGKRINPKHPPRGAAG